MKGVWIQLVILDKTDELANEVLASEDEDEFVEAVDELFDTQVEKFGRIVGFLSEYDDFESEYIGEQDDFVRWKVARDYVLKDNQIAFLCVRSMKGYAYCLDDEGNEIDLEDVDYLLTSEFDFGKYYNDQSDFILGAMKDDTFYSAELDGEGYLGADCRIITNKETKTFEDYLKSKQ